LSIAFPFDVSALGICTICHCSAQPMELHHNLRLTCGSVAQRTSWSKRIIKG